MTTKRVRRSTTTTGGLMEMKDPRFLTPCKKPANQRAFSVLRSEGEGKETTKRIRRHRRSDTANLAKLEFSADLTEEEVKASLEGFGLSTFEVARSEEGAPWFATNSAIVCTDDELIKHTLNEGGVVAYVRRSEELQATSGKSQVLVARIEFTDKGITADDAAAWLEENDVDFDEKDLNNSSGQLVLQRAELEEGADTRRIAADDGVVFVVTRAERQDIPVGYVLAVNEACYYGYGWGQVDFNANLADRTIGEKIRDAQNILNSTLDNILYYNSELTPDAKKALISRTAEQFADYVNAFLDQLPRSLLIPVADASIQRSEPIKESADMATAEAKKENPLTAEGVAEIVKSVIRSEKEADEQAKKDAEAKAEQERVEKEARRAEVSEAVAEAIKPFQEQIEKLGGTTVLRSEPGKEKAERKEKDQERSEPGVFDGLFGNVQALEELDDDSDADDDSAQQ